MKNSLKAIFQPLIYLFFVLDYYNRNCELRLDGGSKKEIKEAAQTLHI